ncbi:MAG: MFS transporter [Candidatus Symbiodolus clandestinus]
MSIGNRSIWNNKAFVTLFGTAFFVNMGVKIYGLALPLVIYDLTQSSVMMGYIRAVEFMPHILLAAFIGVIIDRFNKKLWSQFMLSIQIIFLLMTYLSIHYLKNPNCLLFLAAFIMMACDNGYNNARLAMIKKVIPQDQLNTATAKMSGLYSFFDAVGPMMAGTLFLFSSVYDSFLAVMIVFIVAALVLSRLNYYEVPDPKQETVLASLVFGWKTLRNRPKMWLITLAIMVLNATSSVFTLQILYCSKETLNLSDTEIGYLFFLAGIGGVWGAVVADRMRNRFGLGNLFTYTIALEALGFLLIAAYPSLLPMVVTLFWTSAMHIMTNICVWTYRQEAFDKSVIGRITGITGMISKIGMPVSLMASGYAVSIFGSSIIFIVCALIQLLVAISMFLSPVRNLS